MEQFCQKMEAILNIQIFAANVKTLYFLNRYRMIAMLIIVVKLSINSMTKMFTIFWPHVHAILPWLFWDSIQPHSAFFQGFTLLVPVCSLVFLSALILQLMLIGWPGSTPNPWVLGPTQPFSVSIRLLKLFVIGLCSQVCAEVRYLLKQLY